MNTIRLASNKQQLDARNNSNNFLCNAGSELKQEHKLGRFNDSNSNVSPDEFFDSAGKWDVGITSAIGISEYGFSITSKQIANSSYYLQSTEKATSIVAKDLKFALELLPEPLSVLMNFTRGDTKQVIALGLGQV